MVLGGDADADDFIDLKYQSRIQIIQTVAEDVCNTHLWRRLVA